MIDYPSSEKWKRKYRSWLVDIIEINGWTNFVEMLNICEKETSTTNVFHFNAQELHLCCLRFNFNIQYWTNCNIWG